MKNTASLLLAILAMTAVPAFAHSGDVKDGKVLKKAPKTASHHKLVTYYYITDRTVLGSSLPVVVRKRGKDIDSVGAFATYTRYDLDRAGAESVSGDLVTIDPAISFGRGR